MALPYIVRYIVTMENKCDMCEHDSHHDTDCGEITGYDHLNGEHECGCPGSLAELLAQAWDEGYERAADTCPYSAPHHAAHGNPYCA